MPEARNLLQSPKLNGAAISAVVAVLVVVFAVVTGWWRLEAQIDRQIAKQQAPLEEQMREVKESIDDLKDDVGKLDRSQGVIVGELKHLSRGLGIPPREEN